LDDETSAELSWITRYGGPMKSAYELAMERLNKSEPIAKLNTKQKAEISELESRYAAKIAEQEIMLKDQITAANQAGDWEKRKELEGQLVHERKKLRGDLDEKKDAVRQRGK
jgi:hypothetical protein